MAPTWLAQLHKRRRKPEFAEAWKAFLTAPAAKGEPTIRPAQVPRVKPLKGQKFDPFAKFKTRRA